MERSRRYVLIEGFSLRDVLSFLLLFLVLLVVLFPKGRLEELILKGEETNVDLTEKYIEALLKLKLPPEVKTALLRKYILEGEEKKVEELLARLKEESPERAYELEYLYLKRKFFSRRGDPEEVLGRIRKALSYMILRAGKREKLLWLYREALSFGFTDLAYLAAYRLAKVTGEERWYEVAFLHAWQLGKFREAGKLVGKFTPTRKETLLLLYLYYYQKRDYGRALTYLNLYLSKERGKKELYADLVALYFATGQEEKARSLLSSLLRETSRKEKEEFLLRVMRKLLGLGAYSVLKEFIERYALKFEGDKKFYEELVRAAMATGDPNFAADVAEEVARKLGLIR